MIWVVVENVLDIPDFYPLSVHFFKLIFNPFPLFFKLFEILNEFIETNFGEIIVILNICNPV